MICVITSYSIHYTKLYEGLGLVNKLLESWSGAVIAKIAVLVFIVLFIQKRPQGLFALKGRAVEA